MLCRSTTCLFFSTFPFSSSFSSSSSFVKMSSKNLSHFSGLKRAGSKSKSREFTEEEFRGRWDAGLAPAGYHKRN